MKKYSFDYETGRLRFDNEPTGFGRVRLPRIRAQQLFCRLGGTPFLPMRIKYYRVPKFYYTFLRHRRKKDMDYGVLKLMVWTR